MSNIGVNQSTIIQTKHEFWLPVWERQFTDGTKPSFKYKHLFHIQKSLFDINMRRRSRVRLRTQKVIDRLLYEPEKHKQKFVRSLCQKLKDGSQTTSGNVGERIAELVVGAMNIRGLDGETNAALRRLMKERGFDVR